MLLPEPSTAHTGEEYNERRRIDKRQIKRMKKREELKEEKEEKKNIRKLTQVKKSK